MKITLSKFLSEELEHKLFVLLDNPEIIYEHGLTEECVERMVNTLPPVGGEWDFPDYAVKALCEEMIDYPTFLKKFETPKLIHEPDKSLKFMNHIDFLYDDGGRSKAGYKGDVGDCVTRAIAIATGVSYKEVYDALFVSVKEYSKTKRNKIAKRLNRTAGRNSPRNGVHRPIYDEYLKSLGWKWVAVSGIGTGCRMHLRRDEIPSGTVILRLSRHLATVVDGVLHDTYDSSREGIRCVYGYYIKE